MQVRNTNQRQPNLLAGNKVKNSCDTCMCNLLNTTQSTAITEFFLLYYMCYHRIAICVEKDYNTLILEILVYMYY
jgi:hypothetical protein